LCENVNWSVRWYNRLMSKRQFYSAAGTVLVLAFIFFSYLVHKNHLTQFDFDTTVHFQDHISRKFDIPFSILSDIGQAVVMGIILVLIFLFTKRIKSGLYAIGFFIVFHVIEIYGKYFVHHPPPPEFMLRTINLVQLSPFTVRATNSYPSGHAGRTMFISVICFILIWQSKKLGFMTKVIFSCLILAFDVTMMISRIYLGEHWTSDVIGGTLLGSALGFFTGLFINEKASIPSHAKSEVKKNGLFPKFKIELKRVE
jgi:membrane-associated phospholipid phosphatase